MASKLKAVAPKEVEPAKPKILIYGKPGVGKTWTSLDFPNVYYIDTEGGAQRNHYTDKLKASGGVYLGIDEGSLDFATIINQIQALATEEHPYKTVVIDSISKIFGREIAKEADRLGDKDAFGASKKPAVAFTRQLIQWLDRLDMNVIIIAHEKPLWANGEQAGVTPDCWDKLEYELDLCLNITKQGDTRKAWVKKSRLLGFPDGNNFPWTYEEFSTRYGKDVIEKAAKPIELATPEQVKEISDLLEVVKVAEDFIPKCLTKAKAEKLEDISTEQANALIEALNSKTKKGA